VVNNAGITKDMLSMRMKVSDFEEVLKINLTSAFVFSRDAAVKMLRRKWGRIINMSSIVATLGNMGQANYVASKAAMIGMTKTLAQEFATKGITINCIAPGFIKTPMTDVLTDEVKNTMLSKIPQGKFGEPDDIANTALFLASEEASYITGQTIHVNGGMLMV
jgi:3-oxoacyl-[acyl-carrier protein] reductase